MNDSIDQAWKPTKCKRPYHQGNCHSSFVFFPEKGLICASFLNPYQSFLSSSFFENTKIKITDKYQGYPEDPNKEEKMSLRSYGAFAFQCGDSC